MLCQRCQKEEARVHLTHVLDGKVEKICLCEICAKSKGFELPAPAALADMLLGLGEESLESPVASIAEPELRCPHCGLEQSRLLRRGRFGCAHCYETFADEALRMLTGMHNSTRHRGKTPPRMTSGAPSAIPLSSLRRQLEEAVRREDFETAVDLRDRISALRTQLAGEE